MRNYHYTYFYYFIFFERKKVRRTKMTFFPKIMSFSCKMGSLRMIIFSIYFCQLHLILMTTTCFLEASFISNITIIIQLSHFIILTQITLHFHCQLSLADQTKFSYPIFSLHLSAESSSY